MTVRFTKAAVADLVRIRRYIGLDNPSAASRMAVEIVAACDRLELFPERGKPGLVKGTRELAVIWPYLVVYRLVKDDVEILRVWHGAQQRG